MYQHLEISNQITITPSFLYHFDFKGISDTDILHQIVNYMSIQLGFFFNISNTSNPSCVHKPFDEDEFTHIHTVKFECQVGCPLKASYFFSKVNQCEIDENTGTAKYKKVKRLIGMRRAWKYEKIDEDLEIV